MTGVDVRPRQVEARCAQGHTWPAVQEIVREHCEFSGTRWRRAVSPESCPTCGKRWDRVYALEA